MSKIRKQKNNNRRSLPGLLPVRPSQLAGPASQPSPLYYLNQNKCQKLENRKIITGGAYLGSSLCGPASWPAQLASPAHHRRRPPGASRPGVCPARAHGRSATPPARLPASLASATPRRFFSVPPRSPGLIPLSLPCCSLSLSLSRAAPSLSLSHGRTPPSPPFAIATVSDHPSLPPTSSGAPPRLPLPPHRSTAPRKPCIAATSSFPSSGSDHRRRRIRRLQCVSEPASTPTATAVSLRRPLQPR